MALEGDELREEPRQAHGARLAEDHLQGRGRRGRGRRGAARDQGVPRETKKFQALGARIPKGVLLYGPPGTGKTLLARSVAGEAGVPFFSISGSDFVEMFVGVGRLARADLFEQAKQASPCIIFMNEIDAVGDHRGLQPGRGRPRRRRQTLNQLLVEMDGFEMKDNIILIAATNRPGVLDWRSPAGRPDRQIVVDRPDRNGRRKILEVHTKGKPIDNSVDLDTLAAGTQDLGPISPTS